MAHFAKLGIDNVVLEVLTMDNITTMTPGGIEKEDIGIKHLVENHGHENWKKCSYNTHAGAHANGGTPFRANYPAIGDYYSTEHDIFYKPRPSDADGDLMNSHTLNTTTGLWEPPFAPPALTTEQQNAKSSYRWDESEWVKNNAQGWVLQTYPT
tara:strand:- start:1397 stop:1858 length:462 start_codon:yes stop_codon:yes gene_type:complete